MSKWCPWCERDLPVEQFHKRKASKDGLQSRCKECQVARVNATRGLELSKPPPAPTKPLRVLSLGAGVQSSTVLYLALEHEIEPYDHVVFADVGDEPQAVYENLEYIRSLCSERGVPFHVVKAPGAGSISGDMQRFAAGEVSYFNQPPVFVRNDDGKAGMVKRFCTSHYKIDPVIRKLRELTGMRYKRVEEEDAVVRVTQGFGISWEEMHRMSEPRYPWIVNEYPLVDRRMTRQDCLDWCADRGFKIPSRSSCVFCPYHSDSSWRTLKESDPDGWDRAVRFDEELRDSGMPGLKGKVFLHRTLIPLRDVSFSSSAEPAGEECEGHCGL